MKSIVQEAFRRLEAERAAEAAKSTPWAELKISHKIAAPACDVRRYIRKLEQGPLPEMEKKLQRLAEDHRAIVWKKRGRSQFMVNYPLSFEWVTYYIRRVS